MDPMFYNTILSYKASMIIQDNIWWRIRVRGLWILQSMFSLYTCIDNTYQFGQDNLRIIYQEAKHVHSMVDACRTARNET